jgi:hypothetical protein
MKYCVNCRWHLLSPNSTDVENFDKCAKADGVSLVTGRPSHVSAEYCSVQRKYDTQALCGPEAKWFEPGGTPASIAEDPPTQWEDRLIDDIDSPTH